MAAPRPNDRMLARAGHDTVDGRHGDSPSFSVKPGAVEEYTVDLVWGHHCFRKGHKIMVQVSSTWFPVIDRNPQTFVNIYEAGPEDCRKATHRIYHDAQRPSSLRVQVLER